jgi:hypothetical protein
MNYLRAAGSTLPAESPLPNGMTHAELCIEYTHALLAKRVPKVKIPPQHTRVAK